MGESANLFEREFAKELVVKFPKISMRELLEQPLKLFIGVLIGFFAEITVGVHRETSKEETPKKISEDHHKRCMENHISRQTKIQIFNSNVNFLLLR